MTTLRSELVPAFLDFVLTEKPTGFWTRTRSRDQDPAASLQHKYSKRRTLFHVLVYADIVLCSFFAALGHIIRFVALLQ